MSPEHASPMNIGKELGHSPAKTTAGYYCKIVRNQKPHLISKVRSNSALRDKSKGAISHD